MKFIWTITAFVAVTVMAMPHGAHETREPSVYVRAPEPGCIKRTPNCGYTYIKRSEATEEVKDEDTYLKVREPGCIKRSPNCGYHYIKRSDIE